jgi:hypothetical protein
VINRHLRLALAPVVLLATLMMPDLAHSAACTGTYTASQLIPSFSCTSGDKVYSNFFGFDSNFIAPNASFAINEFTDPAGDTHEFQASNLSLGEGTMISYSYKVTIVGSTKKFKSFETSSTTLGSTQDMSKSLEADPPGSSSKVVQFNGGGLAKYTYTTPEVLPLSFTGSIEVVSGTLTSFSDTIVQTPASAVPGPLPVLGAAAAFGYSRKLRSRIQRFS